MPIRRGFAELLGNPGISRMTSHANMDDFSALQLDDEEGKERAEEEVGDRQEVARPDVVCMVLQEGRPCLRGGKYTPLSPVFLDGAFGDTNPQFEQLPADTLHTPQAIVQRHRLDQRDRLGSDFGVPGSSLGSSPPEPAERLAMPVEKSIGLNNEERLFPVPDGSREHDREQPIGSGTSWALHLTAKDDQLLSQQGVFGDEFSPGAGQIVQGSHEAGAARWPRPPQYRLLDPTE